MQVCVAGRCEVSFQVAGTRQEVSSFGSFFPIIEPGGPQLYFGGIQVGNKSSLLPGIAEIHFIVFGFFA